MRRLFDSVALAGFDVMLVHDAATLAILEVNDRMREAFACEVGSEFELTDLVESRPPFDVAALRTRFDTSLRAGPQRFEWRFRRADGRALWLDLMLRPAMDAERRVVVAIGNDVTARKVTESELRRTRAFLEAAIRQSPVGVVVLDAGPDEVAMANAAALTIVGLPTAADPTKLVPTREWPPVLRDGHVLARDELPLWRALLTREVTEAHELTVEQPSGDVRNVICSATPVFDEEGELKGAVTLFSDITDLRRAEEEGRHRERLLQVFHEQMRDVVLAVDEHGRIDYVTPSVTRMLGRGETELLGATLEQSSLFRASHLADAERDLARVLAGDVLAPREYCLATRSGDEVTGEVVGSPMRGEGGRRRALFVIRDVTERRRETDRRAAREAQTRQSQKLEAVGTLAAGFAHEINNPLTGILNLAELIELGLVKPDELPDIAGRIKALCDRMAGTVQRLVSFANSNATQMECVDAVDVVRATLELAGPQLKRANVRVALGVARGSTPPCACRPTEIQHALLILLTNSIDAMLRGTAAADRRISVDVRETESLEPDLGMSSEHAIGEIETVVRISVRDSGPGVAPDVVHRVFDPFFSTKPPDRGGGLGLWVAQGILRDHRGRLWFETEAGVGTCFHLDLPLGLHPEAMKDD